MRNIIISISIKLAVALLFTGCNSHKSTKKESEVNNSEKDLVQIPDSTLLDSVQKQTFNYFWEGAEPNSGMARERIHMDNIYPLNDQSVVTTGGTGFGLMAILVGIERGFITREQAVERYEKIVTFLENANRFHGAWPHWIDGKTGKVQPFSAKDDGGDLVETAFLIQGLLTVKEYFKNGNQKEKELTGRIQKLWEEVEWNWYTRGGKDVLYWHWSPNHDWDMNFAVRGYNECLIMYVLAAASPTHSVNNEVYNTGWARNGQIVSDREFYDLETIVDHYETADSPVGPLFWAHYSYLGLSPKNLSDKYANYWELNRNHALIHYKHAVSNPAGYKGYSSKSWGLTSSYSMKGYAGHRPDRDLGVISPTAALSSMPYTPKESMRFLRFMYEEQDSLIGKYGPYDAFSFEHNWYLPRYLAIDQGPIPVMIENYRSGLLWNLFMNNTDIQNGLKKLGFKTPYLHDDE
ncbi:glucoamylase family protein [Abyssalbus ytuae]|uniref:Beta-glucosidase n=1 Tax=Abyssalbus ytuae TaxID=2926907 RepID=A0A9E7CSZ9_9FLAO|nr:glucoamylase family protein [Abyssalbus ytuae]UOB17141.1 beta-glucosidase [Abyssalbus ytuae]